MNRLQKLRELYEITLTHTKQNNKSADVVSFPILLSLGEVDVLLTIAEKALELKDNLISDELRDQTDHIVWPLRLALSYAERED